MNGKIFIRLVYSLVFLLLTLVCFSIFYQTQNNVYRVNDLRLQVNDVYESIQDDFVHNETIILEPSDKIITVVDLSGEVLVSNQKNIKIVDLKEKLYMDHAYLENGHLEKIALPLYKDGITAGFVLFEVPKKLEWIRSPYIQIFLIVMTIFLIIYANTLKYKNPPIEVLNNGLMAIRKGDYSEIEDITNSELDNTIMLFNLMVKEIQYILQRQMQYENDKSHFLTMLSHELKTPIATIHAYTEGLIKGVAKDQATKDKYHQIIHTKMEILIEHVNALFAFAQNEMHIFKYNFEEIYGHFMLDTITSHMDTSDGVTIENQVPACLLSVDVLRLEQVIMNIVNNAKKHSSSSTKIKILGYRQDHDVIIEIKDNGTGIDPGDLPHIFDYYFQGKQSEKMDYEGIGLGLAICKSIVEKHRGTIKVRSKLGKGTTFIIQLPLL